VFVCVCEREKELYLAGAFIGESDGVDFRFGRVEVVDEQRDSRVQRRECVARQVEPVLQRVQVVDLCVCMCG